MALGNGENPIIEVSNDLEEGVDDPNEEIIVIDLTNDFTDVDTDTVGNDTEEEVQEVLITGDEEDKKPQIFTLTAT